MTTNTDQQVAQSETLEQIAERIIAETLDPTHYAATASELKRKFLSVLRNERDRAIRIINDHQALDKCEDNCWSTIKAAIREGR